MYSCQFSKFAVKPLTRKIKSKLKNLESVFVAMQINREQIRPVIYSHWKRQLTTNESKQELDTVFGTSAPSVSTVRRWYNEFKRGKTNFKDDPKSGRPSTAVTEENCEKVRQIVEDDPHVTYAQIKHLLGIGSTAVTKILKEKLGLKKVCSRWVPHSLSDEQKSARVKWCREMLKKYKNGKSKAVFDIVTGDETWLYFYDPPTKRESMVWIPKDAPRPAKVKQSRSVGKRMFALFLRKSGFVAKVMLQQGGTINSVWYKRCLSKMFKELQAKGPESLLKRTILHHDNAPAHRSEATNSFLARKKSSSWATPPIHQTWPRLIFSSTGESRSSFEVSDLNENPNCSLQLRKR